MGSKKLHILSFFGVLSAISVTLSQKCPSGSLVSDKWFSSKIVSCIQEANCEESVALGKMIKSGSKEKISAGEGFCGSCQIAFKYCNTCQNNENSTVFPYLNCQKCRDETFPVLNYKNQIDFCYDQDDCVYNYGLWMKNPVNASPIAYICLPCETLFPNCLHCNNVACLLCNPNFKRLNNNGNATECVIERPDGYFPASKYTIEGTFRGVPLKDLEEYLSCPATLTNCIYCEMTTTESGPAAICRQCLPGFYVLEYNGKCVTICPANLGKQNPVNYCANEIPKVCYHAKNEFYCSGCQKKALSFESDYFSNDGICMEKCTLESIPTVSSGEEICTHSCKVQGATCKTCDSEKKYCLECSSGYTLFNKSKACLSSINIAPWMPFYNRTSINESLIFKRHVLDINCQNFTKVYIYGSLKETLEKDFNLIEFIKSKSITENKIEYLADNPNEFICQFTKNGLKFFSQNLQGGKIYYLNVAVYNEYSGLKVEKFSLKNAIRNATDKLAYIKIELDNVNNTNLNWNKYTIIQNNLLCFIESLYTSNAVKFTNAMKQKCELIPSSVRRLQSPSTNTGISVEVVYPLVFHFFSQQVTDPFVEIEKYPLLLKLNYSRVTTLNALLTKKYPNIQRISSISVKTETKLDTSSGQLEFQIFSPATINSTFTDVGEVNITFQLGVKKEGLFYYGFDILAKDYVSGLNYDNLIAGKNMKGENLLSFGFMVLSPDMKATSILFKGATVSGMYVLYYVGHSLEFPNIINNDSTVFNETFEVINPKDPNYNSTKKNESIDNNKTNKQNSTYEKEYLLYLLKSDDKQSLKLGIGIVFGFIIPLLVLIFFHFLKNYFEPMLEEVEQRKSSKEVVYMPSQFKNELIKN